MTFGQTLKQLLTVSGVKSAALAGRLGYDTSYISRWISDVKLPSLKNNNYLLSQIAEAILAESDRPAIERLRQTYCQDSSDRELKQAIENALRLAFNRSHPSSPQPSANRNAVYIPDETYRENIDIYLNAVIQYMQENGTTEIPWISAAPLKSHNNRDFAFWNGLLSDSRIADAHFTMHQLIDSADFSANVDSYCAAICTFIHYHERIHYEFYEYRSVADIHSIQFTFISGKLLCQNFVNPLTGNKETVICGDTTALSNQWLSICRQLQLLPQMLSWLDCNTKHFFHYLYDYVMGGTLCYLLNIMHPVYMSDELSRELMEQYLPGMKDEHWSFYMDYNGLCSKAEKEVIIYRSALLEYMYSGTLLFCGRLIRLSREHRINHLKQILENSKQGHCHLTILNDNNPLLNYQDMHMSLYLSKSSGFMSPSDANEQQIIRLYSQAAVDRFHQFFSHLQALDRSFMMDGTEAYDFIEKGIRLI